MEDIKEKVVKELADWLQKNKKFIANNDFADSLTPVVKKYLDKQYDLDKIDEKIEKILEESFKSNGKIYHDKVEEDTVRNKVREIFRNELDKIRGKK
ncbi:hypothetical protein [Anaerospora sp.]|uniref:hypothetical protein n=1 Tax=Anaerospora sp. TaxID=1960278 RepID=UPI00289B2C07|nr:hypothetical protein [Anaerospora sp.]